MTLNTVGRRIVVALFLSSWMVADVAAVQVTFNLVQSQSTIQFGGEYIGAPLIPQDDPTFPTPGVTDGDPTRPSNRTTLTGTITVDVDDVMAPTMIQILSADMDGTVNGSWLPVAVPGLENEPGCDTDPAGGTDTDRCSSVHPATPASPADIGVKLLVFECCDGAYGALRDFAYNLITEVPDPDGDGPLTATPVVEPVNGLGEFSSLSQHIFYSRGFFDTWLDPGLDDNRDRGDVTGDGGLNQHVYTNNPDPTPDTVTPIANAPKSTYTVTGNLATLTIPLELNFMDPTGLSQFFDGQLLATFEIPGGQDGDHNEDGVVDAADYVAWRKIPSAFGGDPGGYDAFRQNFGEPGPGSSGVVPEPASAILVVIGITGIFFGCRRQGR